MADGRVMTRAADAPTQVREISGHGRVILRAVTFTYPGGATHPGWQWDLSSVVIPAGALRADPNLQTFCCGGPKLWYEAIRRSCVQCGDEFLFGAAEQRYWYETLQFHESSTAIRCPKCRKRRRTGKARREQLARALRETEAHPHDAHCWLELARVTVELRQQDGDGNIDRGLAAARKAWRLSEERLAEAQYYEFVLQRTAGREEKARVIEQRFLVDGQPSARWLALLRRGRAAAT